MSFMLTVIENGGSGFGYWPAPLPYKVIPNADVVIEGGGKTFVGKTDEFGIVVSTIIDTILPISVTVKKTGYSDTGFNLIPSSNNMWIKMSRSGISLIPILAIAVIGLFILSRKK